MKICRKCRRYKEVLTILLTLAFMIVIGFKFKLSYLSRPGSYAEYQKIYFYPILVLILVTVALTLLVTAREHFFVKLRWLYMVVAYLNLFAVLPCIIFFPDACEGIYFFTILLGLASRYCIYIHDTVF